MAIHGPPRPKLDPEALEADRAAARTSDRFDGRDGVDASDAFGDPDAVGGKPPETKPGRRTRRSRD